MGDGEGILLPLGLDRSGVLLGAGALGSLLHMARPWLPEATARALECAGSLLVIVFAVAIGLIDRVRRVALVVPELAINAVLRQQLRVRAALDRLAAGDHDDFVHV